MVDISNKENINKELDTNFDVNERYKFLKKLVKMVVLNKTPSLVIKGPTGLGKTYNTMKIIKKKLNKKNYVKVGGYVTSRGLYNLLYDNKKKLIYFDDCDSILQDKKSRDILLNALDSYSERYITWGSSMTENDPYPQRFEFKGRIIFSTNKEKIDKALVSRSYFIDLDMTTNERIERMEKIIPKMGKNLSVEDRDKAINFIKENKDKIKNLNMRTLLNVIRLIESNPKSWERLSVYSVEKI